MELIAGCVLTSFMLGVIAYDATKFIIPNWLNAAFLLFFVPWLLLSPQPIDWISSLQMFAVLLVVGIGLFALGWMGGGDVKMLAVCGLYVGWSETGMELVVYTAILGGILSILLVALRFMIPFVLSKTDKAKTINIPKIFTMGEPAPYGLAIAGAFLLLLWGGKIQGLSSLSLFV